MQWDTCPMNLCLGQAMESRAVGKEGFGNEWQDSARAGQGSCPGMVQTPGCSSSIL